VSDFTEIVKAIESGASADELSQLRIPETFRAAYLHEDDMKRFEGMESDDKDPRVTYRIGQIETPQLAPDEVLIANMASSVNYNAIWSAIFEPIPSFLFLWGAAKRTPWGARHLQSFHIIGSDGAGVILKVGSGVETWKVGDEVVIAGVVFDAEDPRTQDDGMLGKNQRIWGFETNYGGYADLTIAKVSQLMRKPKHLTWVEAASYLATLGTAYRSLNSRTACQITPGDVVLVWGAVGGMGAFACQLTNLSGGTPVAMVSSPEKADLARSMGVEAVIDRSAEGYKFWTEDGQQDLAEMHRFKKTIRSVAGDDPAIVFEHPGRETFAASVYVAARGGAVVTSAATSGFNLEFDNRFLWMNVKRIVGSHAANAYEGLRANNLVEKARIHPTVSETWDLSEIGVAARRLQLGKNVGKIGIRCLATSDETGVTDTETRERYIDDIMRFKRFAQSHVDLSVPPMA
jgi:crotonyl-CoA reductase